MDSLLNRKITGKTIPQGPPVNSFYVKKGTVRNEDFDNIDVK